MSSIGYLPDPRTIVAGFETGIVQQYGSAQMFLIAPTNGNSEIHMGSISNSDAGKIEAINAANSEPTKLQFSVEGAPRFMLRETTSTITTNLDITGDLTANNILTSSQFAAQYQPTLESTAQDNHSTGIFSLFGTGTASNKLRFMSGSAGLRGPC